MSIIVETPTATSVLIDRLAALLDDMLVQRNTPDGQIRLLVDELQCRANRGDTDAAMYMICLQIATEMLTCVP